MKSLLFICLVIVFAFQMNAQERKVLQQYYHFESTCNYYYTTNKSTVLTLYPDGSFLLEMFSNKRGGEPLYTRSEFSGNWRKQNDTIFFQHLNREINSINENGRNMFSSDQTLFKQVPAFCIIVGDVAVISATVMDNLHVSKGKAMALGEKWAYENAERMANYPKKNFLTLK